MANGVLSHLIGGVGWLLCRASAMTSLLAHEVQAEAGHKQSANGSAEKSTKPQPQLMLALALTESRGARLAAAHLRIAAMARLARLIPSDADQTRLNRLPYAMILPTSRLGNGAQDDADLSASHDDFRDATHALHTLEHAHGDGLVGVAAMGAGRKHGGDLNGDRPRQRHSNAYFLFLSHNFTHASGTQAIAGSQDRAGTKPEAGSMEVDGKTRATPPC
jgi:hypothetical protein